MRVETLAIEGPLLLTPVRHGDARGFFSEVFRADVFAAHVGEVVFVQENHSRSAARGTLRGLHYQAPPRAQGKLVRVTRGAVYDVVVDARRGSPAYGRHIGVELSGDNWRQLWVPPGFLHGFCTLCDDVDVLYKTTDFYSPEHDGAVAFDDPDLAIAWPLEGIAATVSQRDRRARRFADLPDLA